MPETYSIPPTPEPPLLCRILDTISLLLRQYRSITSHPTSPRAIGRFSRWIPGGWRPYILIASTVHLLLDNRVQGVHPLSRRSNTDHLRKFLLSLFASNPIFLHLVSPIRLWATSDILRRHGWMGVSTRVLVRRRMYWYGSKCFRLSWSSSQLNLNQPVFLAVISGGIAKLIIRCSWGAPIHIELLYNYMNGS